MTTKSSLNGLPQCPSISSEVWHEAYLRYHRFWLSLARSAHVSEDDAQDLLHGVLVSIMNADGRTFESLEHIRNYVARAILNRAIEQRKFSLRHSEWNEATEIENLKPEEMTLSERTELRQVLRQGVRKLRPTHFEIIKLRFFSGLTFQEISDLLGIPISTLKSREEVALRKIRATLQKNGY